MNYTVLTPRIRYAKDRTVTIPDDVDPGYFQLAPGEKLIDANGVQVASGAEIEDVIGSVQDLLEDARDHLQDTLDALGGDGGA